MLWWVDLVSNLQMSASSAYCMNFWHFYANKVCLWSSWHDFIASIRIYLQLTERGHLWSTPHEQLCLAQWCCDCWKHFWNSCCGIAFCANIFLCLQYPETFVLLGHFISGNSQKSLEAKSREKCGCSMLTINFWVRNCLVENTLRAGALSCWRLQLLGQSSGLFLHT